MSITHPVPAASARDLEKADLATSYLAVDRYVDAFEDPKDWPLRRKWMVTGVLSATGFNRIMVSTIMAPPLGTIASDFDMSRTESVMALSVYLIAAAFGPLVIGPMSEVWGRRPILHATSLWFLGWNIVCGFANSGSLLIAARLMAGFGASAIYALAGGVLGDVWRAEQRGMSLSLYLLIPLLGAAVGPILGGFIVEHTTWRWMFWSTSILQATLMAFSIPSFRETYAPVIRRTLLQKRHAGNNETQRPSLGDNLFSVCTILAHSLTRPFRLLALHPIIQIISILSAFSYGVLYLLLTTIADMWMSLYGQPATVSGLHYLSLCIGEIIGALFGGLLMDYIHRKLQGRSLQTQGSPEFRVPLMLPGAIFTPTGLLMYGWGAQYRVHWAIVDTGALLAAVGMQISGQAMQAYVIDSYPDHASSASGATQLLRGLAAALFPLFAPTLFATLGYGWGNTLIALLALAIMLILPGILWAYGAKLRASARSSE